ncbi:uncharacterized protein RHOBADRAFT_36126, partial [Rhodotorula graminis WP1]
RPVPVAAARAPRLGVQRGPRDEPARGAHGAAHAQGRVRGPDQAGAPARRPQGRQARPRRHGRGQERGGQGGRQRREGQGVAQAAVGRLPRPDGTRRWRTLGQQRQAVGAQRPHVACPHRVVVPHVAPPGPSGQVCPRHVRPRRARHPAPAAAVGRRWRDQARRRR